MEIGILEILQKDSLFREDCKGWLEKIAIYIGKVWVDPFPLLLLQLSIFTFVFMWLQMCRIFMWMNSKCNQKMVFTIRYLCTLQNNNSYILNVVSFQAFTKYFYLYYLIINQDYIVYYTQLVL